VQGKKLPRLSGVNQEALAIAVASGGMVMEPGASGGMVMEPGASGGMVMEPGLSESACPPPSSPPPPPHPPKHTPLACTHATLARAGAAAAGSTVVSSPADGFGGGFGPPGAGVDRTLFQLREEEGEEDEDFAEGLEEGGDLLSPAERYPDNATLAAVAAAVAGDWMLLPDQSAALGTVPALDALATGSAGFDRLQAVSVTHSSSAQSQQPQQLQQRRLLEEEEQDAGRGAEDGAPPLPDAAATAAEDVDAEAEAAAAALAGAGSQLPPPPAPKRRVPGADPAPLAAASAAAAASSTSADAIDGSAAAAASVTLDSPNGVGGGGTQEVTAHASSALAAASKVPSVSVGRPAAVAVTPGGSTTGTFYNPLKGAVHPTVLARLPTAPAAPIADHEDVTVSLPASFSCPRPFYTADGLPLPAGLTPRYYPATATTTMHDEYSAFSIIPDTPEQVRSSPSV
jgi:hypothetical protein